MIKMGDSTALEARIILTDGVVPKGLAEITWLLESDEQKGNIFYHSSLEEFFYDGRWQEREVLVRGNIVRELVKDAKEFYFVPEISIDHSDRELMLVKGIKKKLSYQPGELYVLSE